MDLPRRAVLVAGLASTVGCLDSLAGDDATGSPRPSASRTRTTATPDAATASPTPSETTGSGDPYLDAFLSYLREQAVEVRALSRTGPRVALTYASDRSGSQAIGAEIGAIAGGFYRQLREGWAVDRLDATLTDGSETQATWHARREWYEAFEAGEISGEELSLRVLQTVERTDDG